MIIIGLFETQRANHSSFRSGSSKNFHFWKVQNLYVNIMAPSTLSNIDENTIERLLERESVHVQNCVYGQNVELLAPEPQALTKNLGLFTASDLSGLISEGSGLSVSNQLSVPIDFRNYLLSPPPPPIEEEWVPRVESPPVTREEQIYMSLFSSKKKLKKAKKKGCTMDGVTYFIGDNLEEKFASKKDKKHRRWPFASKASTNLGKDKDSGAPSINVHLCEELTKN
jgi:hypothetical protein